MQTVGIEDRGIGHSYSGSAHCEPLQFEFFKFRSNRCICNCKCRDFSPIYICQLRSNLSQPALSTRYCHFAPAWNRSVPRPLHLKITSSESLQPVLTTLRFSVAGWVDLVHSIHAQNAPPPRAEMRDESAKSKGKPPNCTTPGHFLREFKDENCEIHWIHG